MNFTSCRTSSALRMHRGLINHTDEHVEELKGSVYPLVDSDNYGLDINFTNKHWTFSMN